MNVTGIMIYYYFVCHRKLWYFINEIGMEQNSELIVIGKTIDENSYKREKKGILIDNTINIDFIKSKAIIHEIKKSKSIEEASIWQIKYYMYYLEQKGVTKVEARIDYPLLKETRSIFITDEDRKILNNAINEIEKIKCQDYPSNILNERKCKKCAYYDLCYV